MNVSRSVRVRAALAAALTIVVAGCTSNPGGSSDEAWREANQRVVDQHKVGGREREVPVVTVPMTLVAGVPVERSVLTTVTIAPGVSATLGWGRGALLERVEMQPGAAYPLQTLNEELIIVVQDGSATIDVGGKSMELSKDQVLYLQPGAVRSMKAGSNGWKAFEVYSPVRLDHLALAGQNVSGVNASFPDQGVTPSLPPGVVVNVNEIQLTPLVDPLAGKTYKRSTGLSRLIWGKNAQISLIRMDPGSEIALHRHPEDQLTHTIRGSLDQGVMDKTFPASGAAGHMLFLPGGMVHSAKLGKTGADQLDVFWPVRPDYVERARKQQALYEQVVAPDAKPKKLAEGFTFTEGPTWLKGKLYFSDMFFANPAAGDWTGSPAKSRLIVMTPDGKSRVLSTGMQSNGTLAAKNGNLIVCDMFGHRVVEVEPATGRVVRVVLDKINGKPIDGPNDLVMDAKGGLYITDPQFTPESTKSQPGKQVYYVAPDGTARVVIGPGEYAMPNGVELSPDGKTLYVNNTWQQPGENFVWAYDVAADGSLTNKRQFAMLNLTPGVLEAAKPADRVDSGADGTAVDTDGRYYVATRSGAQIFLPDGTYAGTIWVPQYPVSLTFGGVNNDVLYIVGESSAWAIQTRVRGFRHPEGMN
ncbi:MAG TPA: SMP-30/gluconolactonase/LRE family protein [Vicinamibacterales bacterium]|nr:SMP-30/gluconolactonase/LRE family protein [Vicinamibacterales bacterium]